MNETELPELILGRDELSEAIRGAGRRVKVDGMQCNRKFGSPFELVGIAIEQPDGQWRCLAMLDGKMVSVEVSITVEESDQS